MFLASNEKLWIFDQTGTAAFIDLASTEPQNFKYISLNVNIVEVIDVVDDSRFIVVTTSPKNENKYEIVSLSLPENETLASLSKDLSEIFENKENGSSSYTLNKTVIIAKNGVKFFAVSNNKRDFIFIIYGGNFEKIIVGRLTADYKLEKVMPPIDRKHKTCSVTLSDNGIAAVGSSSGAIDLYYHLFENSRPVPLLPRGLKWHIDPVKALSFSLNGNYLLSGGNERVLVLWQLTTGRPQFLPRLNGEISSIVVDPSSELYALRLAGSEILVLSSIDLLSRLQISGIKYQPPAELITNKKTAAVATAQQQQPPIPVCTFAIHPHTKHIYLPLPFSSLIQIYDIDREEQVGMISVAPALQTGKVRTESSIKDPQITHINFSYDGKWMATVDEYTPPSIDRLLSKDDKEINLKFWRYKESNNSWVLTTRIAAPHGNKKNIVNLIPAGPSFHRGHAFLTTSENGGLRLWMPQQVAKDDENVNEVDNNSNNKKNDLIPYKSSVNYTLTWSVRRSLGGRLHNPESIAVVWSSDGSAIFLAYGKTVYVINARTFEICSTLPNVSETPVQKMAVMGSKLVIISQSRITVYDLIQCLESWTVAVDMSVSNAYNLVGIENSPNSVANGPKTFAVGVNNMSAKKNSLNSRVYIFSIDSPVPVHVEQLKSTIISIQPVSGSSESFEIMDHLSRFFSLSNNKKSSDNLESNDNKDATEEKVSVDSFEAALGELYSKASQVALSETSKVLETADYEDEKVLINKDSFDNVLDHETGSMTDLFDRVMSIVAPKRK